MTSNHSEILKAANALRSAILAKEFQELGDLMPKYREAVSQAALVDDFWMMNNAPVSMQSILESLSVVLSEELTSSDMVEIIENLPISSSVAWRLVDRPGCPVDLLVSKLMKCEFLPSIEKQNQWLLPKLTENNIPAADAYLSHILSVRSTNNKLSKENLTYIFNALKVIHKPSKALAKELSRVDVDIFDELKRRGDSVDEFDSEKQLPLEVIACLQWSGCKEAVRFALTNKLVDWIPHLNDAAIGDLRVKAWNGLLDAKVAFPKAFIKEAIDSCGYRQSPTDESPAFVYFLFLSGRNVDVLHTPSPQSLSHQLVSLMKALGKAVNFCDSLPLKIDYESRLNDVLQFMSDGVQSDERFAKAATESGLSGRFFEKFPRARPHLGQIFTQELGL